MLSTINEWLTHKLASAKLLLKLLRDFFASKNYLTLSELAKGVLARSITVPLLTVVVAVVAGVQLTLLFVLKAVLVGLLVSSVGFFLTRFYSFVADYERRYFHSLTEAEQDTYFNRDEPVVAPATDPNQQARDF